MILIILTFEQNESKKYEHQKVQIISFLKIFLKFEYSHSWFKILYFRRMPDKIMIYPAGKPNENGLVQTTGQ